MWFVIRDDIVSVCLDHVKPFDILSMNQFIDLVNEVGFVGSEAFKDYEGAQWYVESAEDA
jgi:hypothetical protein